MSRPVDDRGAPVRDPGANTLEPAESPVTGPLRYTEKKTITIDKLTSVDEVAGAPVTVTVDGDKILQGTQRADALALLGISEEVVDAAWRSFVVDVNRTNFVGNQDWGQPHQHQEGMGWQLDVEVVQDRRDGVDGLADIDPRSAKRSVTYSAKKWHYTDADIEAGGTGFLGSEARPPSGWTVETKKEPLEAAGAVGATWRRVEQSEIDSTVNTSEALLAARMELGNALKEIQVAIKVANAAWQGPRSQAAKFKFGLEYEVIGAAWRVTDEWRRYIHDLVTEQKAAKEASDQLERELIIDGVLLVLPSLAGRALKLVFSAGRAAKTALAGSRVLSAAEKIERIMVPLRSGYGALAAQIGRSKIALNSTRILARSAGGLSVTAAVNSAGGRPTTGDDWLMAFALAGVGHGVSEGAGALLAKMQEKHGVSFVLPVLGAAKGGADGLGQTAVKAGTNQALAAPFALGIVSEARKEVVTAKAKNAAREAAENDPAVMQRAMQRYRKAYKGGGRPRAHSLEERKALQKYIRQEVDAVVDGKVDPALDFTFGVGTQAAEKVHETTTRPPPRLDLPGAPSGTVPRRVRSPR
jgi:hypothetical protein